MGEFAAAAVAVLVKIGIALGATTTAGAIALAVYAIVQVGLLAYSVYSMFADPGNSSFANEVRGRTQIVRSAVAPHRIIYGQCMVSGPLIATFSTGNNNKYLYLVIVLASHEVEEIGDVWLGDKLSTDKNFWKIIR